MIEPVERITLPQNILEKLILEIKRGTWPPGTKIPNEKELASSFSVSRNCIREALKTLSNMKILESRPGKGTFVAKDAIRKILTSELIEKGYKDSTLKEITEVRILLESQSAFWAAKRASEEELEELSNVLKQSKANKNMSLDEQTELHFEFHEAIARLSKNSFLIRLLNSIRAEIEAERLQYEDFSPEDQMDLVKDQEEIIHHILNREAKEARDAMERHLIRGLRLLSRSPGHTDLDDV